jgi:hypothetical protein
VIESTSCACPPASNANRAERDRTKYEKRGTSNHPGATSAVCQTFNAWNFTARKARVEEFIAPREPSRERK